MADNTPSNKIAGISQAWSDPKARKGMLLAGGILVVVGVVAFTMMNRQQAKVVQAPASASVVAPPTGDRDVTAATSDQYKKLVTDVDHERSAAAKADPTNVVMPTLAGFTSAEESKRREEDARAAAERGRLAALEQAAQSSGGQFKTSAQAAGATNGQPVASPQDIARGSAEYKVTSAFLNAVVATPGQGGFSPIYAPRASTSSTSGAAGGATGTTPAGSGPAIGPGQSSASPSAPSSPPVVRVGEIVFGTTDIAMSTDFSGPVTATIHQGKFSGARLIGQKSLEQDALVIRFTLLSPVNGGRAIPINAYAVSLGDAKKFGLTGLEGETDYHVFQRYILPAAIAFTQSYGLSAGVTGQTAVAGQNGSVGTSVPGLTTAQRTAIAVGAAMGPVLNDVARFAARPITVSMQANTEIGIMFAADVLNDGQLGAGFTPPAVAPMVAPMVAQQRPAQPSKFANYQYGTPQLPANNGGVVVPGYGGGMITPGANAPVN